MGLGGLGGATPITSLAGLAEGRPFSLFPVREAALVLSSPVGKRSHYRASARAAGSATAPLLSQLTGGDVCF